MNTWFHGLANLTLAHRIQRRLPWLRLPVVLFSSLVPDLPLFGLTLWYFARYGFGFGPRYDALFYHDPLWVVAHNLFHAPFVILTVGLVGFVLYRRGRRMEEAWGRTEATAAETGWRRRRFDVPRMLLSFAFGTGLHTLLDIPTHHDDGPLLLFPFDLHTRFLSPVSYWDPEHYGLIVFPIEIALMLAMGAYWWGVRRSRARRQAS
jgi:hypothetical protein